MELSDHGLEALVRNEAPREILGYHLNNNQKVETTK
jgi:hypothetical protein